MTPRVDEDGESYAEERHEGDQGVTHDSSEDHARRVRSDGLIITDHVHPNGHGRG